jgi:NADH:ubiquinone oxidoreductase subunit C
MVAAQGKVILEGKQWGLVCHDHALFFVLQAVNGPASSSVLYQEPTIYTTPENLVPLCYFLRDHVNTQFKCLIDITAVDFPEREHRFEVVYHLLSPKLNSRLRIKVGLVPCMSGPW